MPTVLATGQALQASRPAPRRQHRQPPRPAVVLRGHAHLQTQPASTATCPAYGYPDPEPTLAGLLDGSACDHAARHGWNQLLTSRTRIALRVLVGLRLTTDVPIPTSDIARLAEHGLPVRAVRAVLADAGLLTDDHAVTQAWFERQVEGLPTAMTTELREWFDVMHHGSVTTPRRRPRAPSTIKTLLRWAMPALEAFAVAGHESLREISRADVTQVVPASGDPRFTAGRGLRSIFSVLKARSVVFVNPMTRIDVGTHSRPTPLPLAVEDLRDALKDTDPTRAALTALIAFHGLQPAEVRDLRLVDIRDGRLQLARRTLPLAEPVRTSIARYLDHRNQRWPNTINPHLFVNTRSALSTEAVGRCWVNTTLGRTARSIRQDRILDEILAGADIRRICDLFDITVGAAEHYTAILDHPGLDAGDHGDLDLTR